VKALKVLVLIISLLLYIPGNIGASQRGDVPVQDYREGAVLVKYRSSAGERGRGRVRGLVRAWKTRKYRHVGVEKLFLGPGLSALEAVDLLSSDPEVEYAELSVRVEYLNAPRVEPSDPGFTSGDQWYLDAPFIAGSHIGTAGTIFINRDIDAPEAWAVMEAVFDSTMAASVGVIDSGCGEFGIADPSTGYQPGHEDLPNSTLWLNPAELGNPGTDSPSDLNSHIDDVNGWDYFGSDNSVADEYDGDAPYHGTHISGIVAGQWGNNAGVAGIGKGQVKVLPLRALYSDEIIGAIDYAIET